MLKSFLLVHAKVLVFGLGVGVGTAQAASIYNGITFPDGDASFADKVTGSVLGDGVTSPYDDPTQALGTPTGGATFYSLGRPGQSPDNLDNALFGSITVEFTDNSLTTSGDNSADLFVFEIGAAVERYTVEISTDSVNWITVATITGQPSTIDIDGVAGVNDGDQFSFVRVTDAPGGPASSRPFAGPDIDAIGAISSAPPVPTVPLPAAGWALIIAMGTLFGLRRRA